MARRGKVYGKQKTNDLVIGLQNLNIASPARGMISISCSMTVSKTQVAMIGKSKDRYALAEGSRNLRLQRQDASDNEPDKDASDKENAIQIGGVTHSKQTFSTSAKSLFTDTSLELSATGLDKSGGRFLSAELIKKPNEEITALTSLESVNDEVVSTIAWFKTQAEKLHIEKIAEGSYASILRMQLKNDPSGFSIWKLMPIKSKDATEPEYDYQTFIEDAVSEVKALSLMSEIPGFVELRKQGVRVLQGIVPPVLQRIFTAWAEANPDEATNTDEYSENQYWLLIEMSDAGSDLEMLLKKGFPDGTRLNKERSGSRLTPYQAWDIFWGVAEALAAGEMHAQFEHRDLHPGNICIKRKASTAADDSNATEAPANIIRYTDLEVTLIDYTLSRAKLGQDEILVNSMQDKELFNQYSEDENDQRQYETYRHMRDLVEGRPTEGSYGRRSKQTDTTKLWRKYVPKTNLLWLHHLLFILLQDTQGYRSVRMTGIQGKLVKILVTILGDLDPEKVDEWIYPSARLLVEVEVLRRRQSLDDVINPVA